MNVFRMGIKEHRVIWDDGRNSVPDGNYPSDEKDILLGIEAVTDPEQT